MTFWDQACFHAYLVFVQAVLHIWDGAGISAATHTTKGIKKRFEPHDNIHLCTPNIRIDLYPEYFSLSHPRTEIHLHKIICL